MYWTQSNLFYYHRHHHRQGLSQDGKIGCPKKFVCTKIMRPANFNVQINNAESKFWH